MTVHPYTADDSLAHRADQERPDTTSPYDSAWAKQPERPPQESSGLDQVMGQGGKIYVVLAVVLLIWTGLLVTLYRTDRKIDRLERRLDRDISEDH